MYNINNKNFTSKVKLTNYVRNIITEMDIGKITDTNHHNFMVELLNRHIDADRKIGCGIKYFYIERNLINKRGLQTNIKRIDNSLESFSWVSCCSATNPKMQLYSAMRQSIYDTIKEYKDNHEHICQICKKEDKEYYHVDHDNPSFRELRDNFLRIEAPPTLFNKHESFKMHIFREEDLEYSEKWKEYHDGLCNLQILCEKCNLTKSDKKN